MTAVDEDDDIRDVVKNLPGADQCDFEMFIFGSARDAELMHAEGRKRGWKIHSTVMAPAEVHAADNGEFPNDIISAAPTTRAYFNQLAVGS